MLIQLLRLVLDMLELSTYSNYTILSPTNCTPIFSDILYYNICKPIQHVRSPMGSSSGSHIKVRNAQREITVHIHVKKI